MLQTAGQPGALASIVAIPSVRVSVFRPDPRAGGRAPGDHPVAIPSVRVSVFRLCRHAKVSPWASTRPGRNPLGSGLGVSSPDATTLTPTGAWLGARVAIPSVRVSVFRPPVAPVGPGPSGGRGPRRNPLGSGLGVSSPSSWCPTSGTALSSPVAIPSVRVSVFRPSPGRGHLPGRRLASSQSPRFGSRCFVEARKQQGR